jgi:hypothetical protein
MCGAGPDLEELRRRHHDMGLESIVNFRSWTAPAELLKIHALSHAAIVPTRSSFAERLAIHE